MPRRENNVSLPPLPRRLSAPLVPLKVSGPSVPILVTAKATPLAINVIKAVATTNNIARLIILPLLANWSVVMRRVCQIGGEKRIPPTTPSSTDLFRGIFGSRLHHWLPGPFGCPPSIGPGSWPLPFDRCICSHYDTTRECWPPPSNAVFMAQHSSRTSGRRHYQ